MTSWPTISLARPMETLVDEGVVVLGTDADGRSRQLLLQVRSLKGDTATVWWSLLPLDRYTMPKQRTARCAPIVSLGDWLQEATPITPTAAAVGVPISWGRRDRRPLVNWPELGGSLWELLAMAVHSWRFWAWTVGIVGFGGLMAWDEPGTALDLLAALWWAPLVIMGTLLLVLGMLWLVRALTGVGVMDTYRRLRADEIEARIAPLDSLVGGDHTVDAAGGPTRSINSPMGPPRWSVVSPDAPLSLLLGVTVLVWPESVHADAPMVIDVARGDARRWEHRAAVLTYARLGSTDGVHTKTLDPSTRLNDFCDRHLRLVAAHVLVVPAPVWATGVRRRTATWVPREDDPSVGYQEHELATRMLAFTQPDAPAVARPAPSAARARVDAVKEEYGELRADIVYRIESSALFDDTVPLTREFSLLLMRWEDESPRGAPSTLERLAMELRLAFDTARQHAEAVGLAHLPRTARSRAERAAKAAQLAVHAATAGEREAAATQLARLLDGISLHYLPGPRDVQRMIGEARPQLGPAP